MIMPFMCGAVLSLMRNNEKIGCSVCAANKHALQTLRLSRRENDCGEAARQGGAIVRDWAGAARITWKEKL